MPGFAFARQDCGSGLEHRLFLSFKFRVQKERKKEKNKSIRKLNFPSGAGKQGRRQRPRGDKGSGRRPKAGGHWGAAPATQPQGRPSGGISAYAALNPHRRIAKRLPHHHPCRTRGGRQRWLNNSPQVAQCLSEVGAEGGTEQSRHAPGAVARFTPKCGRKADFEGLEPPRQPERQRSAVRSKQGGIWRETMINAQPLPRAALPALLISEPFRTPQLIL